MKMAENALLSRQKRLRLREGLSWRALIFTASWSTASSLKLPSSTTLTFHFHSSIKRCACISMHRSPAFAKRLLSGWIPRRQDSDRQEVPLWLYSCWTCLLCPDVNLSTVMFSVLAGLAMRIRWLIRFGCSAAYFLPNLQSDA